MNQTTPPEIDFTKEALAFNSFIVNMRGADISLETKIGLIAEELRSFAARIAAPTGEGWKPLDINIIPSSISYSQHDVKLMLNVNDAFFTISSEFDTEKVREEVTICFKTIPDKCRFLNGVREEQILPMIQESFTELAQSLRAGESETRDKVLDEVHKGITLIFADKILEDCQSSRRSYPELLQGAIAEYIRSLRSNTSGAEATEETDETDDHSGFGWYNS